MTSLRTTAAYIDGIALFEAVLNVHHEPLDITTEHEPDPSWTHTDDNGHFHAWSLDGRQHSDRLPTLRGIQIEEPCNGCCGTDGPCEGYTRTEYICTICAEVIEPKMRRTSGRKYAPGLMTWSVEVQMLANDAWPLLGRQQVSFWTDMGKSRNYFGAGYLQKTSFGGGDLVTATIHGVGPLGERGKP